MSDRLLHDPMSPDPPKDELQIRGGFILRTRHRIRSSNTCHGVCAFGINSGRGAKLLLPVKQSGRLKHRRRRDKHCGIAPHTAHVLYNRSDVPHECLQRYVLLLAAQGWEGAAALTLGSEQLSDQGHYEGSRRGIRCMQNDLMCRLEL